MRANRANPNGFPDPAPNFHLSLLLSSFVQQGPDPVDSLASGPTYRRGAMDFSTEAGPSGRPAVTVQGPLKGGSKLEGRPVAAIARLQAETGHTRATTSGRTGNTRGNYLPGPSSLPTCDSVLAVHGNYTDFLSLRWTLQPRLPRPSVQALTSIHYSDRSSLNRTRSPLRVEQATHAGDTCSNLFGSDPLAYRTEQQQRCLCFHPSVRHSRVGSLESVHYVQQRESRIPSSLAGTDSVVHRVAPGSGHSLVSGPQLRLAGSGSSCLVHLHHPKAAKSPKEAPGQATYRRPSRSPRRPSSEFIPFSRERADLSTDWMKIPNCPNLSSIISSLSLADCHCNCNCKPNRFVPCVFGPFRRTLSIPYRGGLLVPTIFAAS
uniref:Uncharacterized protein n=1 Tax=Neurospora crassa TaxID=5141 RepID=Q6MFH2_NEUCS|nr:hypothetical protein [Neurospora crassa]